MDRPFSFPVTLGESLRRANVEFDQKLHRAFRRTSSDVFDSTVFHALNEMNVVSTQLIDINRYSGLIAKSREGLGSSHLARPWDHDYEYHRPVGYNLEKILNIAFASRSHAQTITSSDFLKALVGECLSSLDSIDSRPRTADLLALIYCGNERAPLSSSTAAVGVLEALRVLGPEASDFQYFLSIENDRIVFRVASVLGDYVQRSSSGLWVPQRAILTHFRDHFGGFTPDEIDELEHLLNNGPRREDDFQRFFEAHPHFLRRWDYREVYPHVVLARPEGEGSLIPDFILTNRELQRAAVLELKLPSPLLIRRQNNRDRFAAAVNEARAQLLRYRDWFRESANRQKLVQQIGMEIYEPELIVVIGRSSEFQEGIDRQRLAADNPDLKIVTYDDLLASAKQRRMLIEGA